MKRHSPRQSDLVNGRWSTNHRGFTLFEMLTVLFVIASLALLGVALGRYAMTSAATGRSIQQLSQLVAANYDYANDHNGIFCPAISRDNLVRWHGGRKTVDEPFQPELGYLHYYLNQHIITDPLLKGIQIDSWEANAGGYGYNATYIGGSPGAPFSPMSSDLLENRGRVLMFATTAFATKKGLMEYPFADPPTAVGKTGRSMGQMQPSLHFRASGNRAIVAWCDGRVTLEEINADDDGPNYYGGDNKAFSIGFFGPKRKNGYWNPNSPVATKGIK